MTGTRKVLSIVDPTAERQPALARAAALARALNAELELFICDYDPHLAGQRFFDSENLQAAREQVIDQHREALNRLREPLVRDGLTVGCDVRWGHPLHQGIVEKVAETQPVLVVKDTHYHAAMKRTLFSNTDWNLIRSCPSPLMLVKPRAIRPEPLVIAAVDPTHEHDKSAALDHEILAFAKELASATHGQLHVFHAFDPAPVIAAASHAMAAPVAVPVNDLTTAVEKQHREAFDALVDDYPLGRDRRHFGQGVPHELLVELAQDLNADFVVMGAVSRSGLRRLFIGSTAERVLDRLPCDLVIVRPA